MKTLFKQLTTFAMFVVLLVLVSNAWATYTPNKQTVSLFGIGSAPACPSLWTELVGETSAGTLAPVTALTTVSIAPVTAVTTTSIAPLTSISAVSAITDGGSGGKFCTPGGSCSSPQALNLASSGGATSYTVANGGTTTSYSVANGATATTYTLKYRICEKS